MNLKTRRHGKADTAVIVIIVTLAVVAILMFVICIGAALLLPAVQQAREAARRSQCKNNLKQIGLALHNYHDTYGKFPPSVVTAEDGTPMHSWRVLILPYLGEQGTYNLYDFSVPWDDPANQAVMAMIPNVYKCPSSPETGAANYSTHYLAVVGPTSVLRPVESLSVSQISNGTSQTAMVGEVSGSSIEWTNPTDVPEGQAATGFGSFHPNMYNVLFADGSVQSGTGGAALPTQAAPLTQKVSPTQESPITTPE